MSHRPLFVFLRKTLTQCFSRLPFLYDMSTPAPSAPVPVPADPIVTPPTTSTAYVNGHLINSLSLNDAEFYFLAVVPQSASSSSTRASSARRTVDAARADLLAALHRVALANDAVQTLGEQFYFWVTSVVSQDEMAAFSGERARVSARIAEAAGTPPDEDGEAEGDDDEEEDVGRALPRPSFTVLALPDVGPVSRASERNFAMPGASRILTPSSAPLAQVFLTGVPSSQDEVSYIYIFISPLSPRSVTFTSHYYSILNLAS